MLRMNEAVNLEVFNSLGDGIVDQIKTFAKSDTASQLIETAKGFLSKKKGPTAPVMAPGPYLAPTTSNFDWKVALAIGGGTLGLGVLLWAILRKS